MSPWNRELSKRTVKRPGMTSQPFTLVQLYEISYIPLKIQAEPSSRPRFETLPPVGTIERAILNGFGHVTRQYLPPVFEVSHGTGNA